MNRYTTSKHPEILLWTGLLLLLTLSQLVFAGEIRRSTLTESEVVMAGQCSICEDSVMDHVGPERRSSDSYCDLLGECEPPTRSQPQVISGHRDINSRSPSN